MRSVLGGSLLPLPPLLQVRRVIESPGVPAARMPRQQLISRVPLRGVLGVAQRRGVAEQHERPVPAHAAHLGGLHQVALDVAGVSGGRAAVAAANVLRVDLDGLLADHLGNHLLGVHALAAQVEQRVAVVHDGLRIVAVGALELGEALQDDGHVDVAAADDRDHVLDVRQPAHVGELVADKMHGARQGAAGQRVRLVAEHVHRLPQRDGQHEAEGGGRVGAHHEDRALAARVAKLRELQLVVVGEVAQLRHGEGHEPRVAADEDALHGLAGGVLEGLVAPQHEVVVHAHRLADLHPPEARGRLAAERAARLPRAVARRRAARLHQAHARLDLPEQQVQRARVVIVVLPGLRQREKRDEPTEVAVLGRAIEHQVADEGGVEQPLGLHPELVAHVVLVAGGVGDEALRELDDPHLVADEREGVHAGGDRHAHQVHAADLVAAPHQRVAEQRQLRALRVDDEVVRVHLQDVGYGVPPGLAGAGAPDDEDVSGPLLQLPAPALAGVDREPVVLGEDDVVEGVLGVREPQALRLGTPTRGSVLFADSAVALRSHQVGPCKPHREEADGSAEQGVRLGGDALRRQDGRHGLHGRSDVLQPRPLHGAERCRPEVAQREGRGGEQAGGNEAFFRIALHRPWALSLLNVLSLSGTSWAFLRSSSAAALAISALSASLSFAPVLA